MTNDRSAVASPIALAGLPNRNYLGVISTQINLCIVQFILLLQNYGGYAYGLYIIPGVCVEGGGELRGGRDGDACARHFRYV